MESQAVQESLPLPGTNLHLVYHSARTKGYLSIIQLQLTPEETPSSLTRVHVKVRSSYCKECQDMSNYMKAMLCESQYAKSRNPSAAFVSLLYRIMSFFMTN